MTDKPGTLLDAFVLTIDGRDVDAQIRLVHAEDGTETGRLISMPYSLEVNDHYPYNVFGYSPAQYTDMLKRHFDTLLAEGEDNGTVMCIPLHAYLVGRAHRIDPFREVLEHVSQHADDVWITTGGEIADYYLKTYYDDVAAAIGMTKAETA